MGEGADTLGLWVTARTRVQTLDSCLWQGMGVY